MRGGGAAVSNGEPGAPTHLGTEGSKRGQNGDVVDGDAHNDLHGGSTLELVEGSNANESEAGNNEHGPDCCNIGPPRPALDAAATLLGKVIGFVAHAT